MKKSKRATPNPLAALAEDERLIEVLLVLAPESSFSTQNPRELPELLFSVRINEESSLVNLQEAALAANQNATGGAVPPLVTDPHEVTLMQHRVHVSQLTLAGLLGGGREVAVDAFSLPQVTTEPGKRSQARPSITGNTTATASTAGAGRPLPKRKGGPNGKQKAKNELIKPPDDSLRIASLLLPCTPLMTARLADFDIFIPPLGSCHIRLKCSDSPLLSASMMTLYRPVCLRLHRIDGLTAPNITTTSTNTDAHNTSDDVTTGILQATFTVAGQTVRSPPLYTHQVTAPSGTPSPLFEVVIFIGSEDSLAVYRNLYHVPCQLALTKTLSVAPPSTLAEVRLGGGTISVRDYVMNGQQQFREVVPVIPDGGTGTTSAFGSCVAMDCNVDFSVDFFQPFPLLRHVAATGEPLEKQFLTRAVLALPYDASWVAEWLRLLMREVTARPRATENVYRYIEPPLEPVEEVVEVSHADKKPRAMSKGGSKKKGGARNTQAVPPPAVVIPSSFDGPLRVVSPPGLSGFEISDGVLRVFCLEGSVPEVHDVISVLSSFTASVDATAEVQMLFNSELFAPERAYIKFPPLVTLPPALQQRSTAKVDENPGSPDATTTITSSQDLLESYEVEPSGTGGRIHRIRLRDRFSNILKNQSYLLGHTLSKDCLRCIQRFQQLRKGQKALSLVEHDWLPSAVELIALERSFGQTLELEDLYGKVGTDIPSRPPECTASAMSPTRSSVPRNDRASVLEQRASATGSAIVVRQAAGKLVNFFCTLKTSRRHRVPEVVLQRFPQCLWMTTLAGEDVLCAFPHSAPTGLLRYHVEGQVVVLHGSVVLYVLSFNSLAKSCTSSRNPAYETQLRNRERDQRLNELVKMRKQHTVPACLTQNETNRGHVTLQTLDNLGQDRSESSDSDGDDIINSDYYDHCTSQRPSRVSNASFRWETAQKYNKSAQLRCTAMQSAVASRLEAAVSYEKLWQMYDERAPPAKPPTKILPPLHF